jgi:hypothetical protein
MSSPTAHRVHLLGTRPGNVKNLGGFRKSVHKIPAALPDAMFERQFPAMCAPDLDQLSRDLFEKLRSARGYKRKELGLHVDSPSATLTTTDFTLDLLYAPDPDDPGDFRLTYDLHTIRDIAAFGDGSLNDVFAGVFNRVSLGFGEVIDLEQLIDEIEDQPGGQANLTYPPDCSECRVKLPGFAGEVRVTAREMEVVSPAAASPAELVKTFVEAGEVLAANPTLGKLIPRRG